MAGARLYSCFDFRLSSTIPLPELIEANDPGDERPLVTIAEGAVAETLEGDVTRRRWMQIAGDTALMSAPATARYRIEGGERIVVERLPGASERNVRLFLLGSVLGVVAYRRGLLPLHANALVVNGEAVAFAGQSGAGKSTLAAWFVRAGYEVLCDDVCVLRFDADGRPFAWPGLPRLKLWGDAATEFGHDKAALDPAVEGKDKYHVGLRGGGTPRPIPLRSLYLLGRAEAGAGLSIGRLRGQAAMQAALHHSYRRQFPTMLGLREAHFARCVALVQHAGIFEARRAWGFDVFDEEARRIEAHLRGG